MPAIWEWPREWYRFTSGIFRLQPRSITASLPWIGGVSANIPHAHPWVCKATVVPPRKVEWQEVDSFLSRIDGQHGLIRLGHCRRAHPRYNRENSPTSEPWSDETYFTDGTGFVSGLLPPTCHVAIAAEARSDYLTLKGLPVSLTKAIYRGDLIEIRPNGVPAEFPHLYEAVHDSGTDSSGQAGFEIRPRLRRGIAANDQAVTVYPTTLFRLAEAEQGAGNTMAPGLPEYSLSLIEALDLV